jgi:hypothetical protein
MFRFAILVALGIVAIAAIAYFALEIGYRSPPLKDTGDVMAPSIAPMTLAEYTEVAGGHERPYILRYESSSTAVLLFGAEHTRNPSDKQLERLRRLFTAFRPDVVLVEGRPGGPFAGLSDPVVQFGESGFAYALARKGGLPCYSWEVSREAEARLLLKEFPRPAVAIYLTLRPYFSAMRFGKPSSPELAVEESLDRTAKLIGNGAFSDIAALDRAWELEFPNGPNWRDVSDQYGLPGILERFAQSSNLIRDMHLAKLIIQLADSDMRVLAVMGSAHAVKIERSLTSEFKIAPTNQ